LHQQPQAKVLKLSHRAKTAPFTLAPLAPLALLACRAALPLAHDITPLQGSTTFTVARSALAARGRTSPARHSLSVPERMISCLQLDAKSLRCLNIEAFDS
jgi:hypothetical protein